MTLIEEYRKIAKERWEYLEHGNSRKGNKCFDKLVKIAMELNKCDGLEKLIILLDDENDGVKFETASILLFVCEDEAIQALEKVATKRGVLSFCAEQTLIEWKAGNMKFPFED